MSEISRSIWTQDKNKEWKLFFNIGQNPSSSSSNIHKEELKIKKNAKNLSKNNLTLGTLMMTPKGIGHLIKNINGIAYIRFNQDVQEYEFLIESISNFFNCYIVFIVKGNIDIVRLKLKVDGIVENIFEELSKLNKINLLISNYSLVYNKCILKEETSFENLNISNNAKILIYESSLPELKISRFSLTNKFWYSYNQDGITFSVTQDIYLLGVGIYRSHDNITISGVLKIIEGPNITGKIISEANGEIQPSSNQLTAIGKVKLHKGIICKKNADYSIIFVSNTTTNTYSGSKGLVTVEGEKGVLFTFKKLVGNKGGTNVSYGNFPEIYYSRKQIYY